MSKALKIGLIRKGSDSWIGGLEYIKNLALATRAAAVQAGQEAELALLSSEQVPSTLAGFPGESLRRIPVLTDIPPVRFGRVRRLFSAGKHDRPLDRAVRAERFDFVYPIDALARSIPCRRAAWIPDLQHRVLPAYSTPAELEARENWIASMMADAPTLVFSSLTSRRDFEAHYDSSAHDLRVLRFRISLPDGLFSDAPGPVVAKYSLPRRFLLVSNQFWQHKNHLLLLEAMAVARTELPDLMVAMTGAMEDYRNPAYVAGVTTRIDELQLRPHLRLLGLIPKRDQLQLLRACRAVVQPSLFEGWNTVVEESRCLGKLILLSDLPVHREQDAPLSRYFDPTDADALARLIIEAWSETATSEDEAKAVAAYADLFRQFGRDFLEIAHSSGGARA